MALSVYFNFPLQSFSVHLTFKSGIAASGEPIPSESGRFGECLVEISELLQSISKAAAGLPLLFLFFLCLFSLVRCYVSPPNPVLAPCQLFHRDISHVAAKM